MSPRPHRSKYIRQTHQFLPKMAPFGFWLFCIVGRNIPISLAVSTDRRNDSSRAYSHRSTCRGLGQFSHEVIPVFMLR